MPFLTSSFTYNLKKKLRHIFTECFQSFVKAATKL